MRLPAALIKNYLTVYNHGRFIEFKLFSKGFSQAQQDIRYTLDNLVFGVEGMWLYDRKRYPDEFHLLVNGRLYPNHKVPELLKNPPQEQESISIIVPNRYNIETGAYKINFSNTELKGFKLTFKLIIQEPPIKTHFPDFRTGTPFEEVKTFKSTEIDFQTQRICPMYTKIVDRSNNYCKYCGEDISAIPKMSDSDDITKHIATTALKDQDSIVRQEAVDTLRSFKKLTSIGILTKILSEDPDENVRKAALKGLGKLEFPFKEELLSIGLKDASPLVRTKTIELLKKLRK